MFDVSYLAIISPPTGVAGYPSSLITVTNVLVFGDSVRSAFTQTQRGTKRLFKVGYRENKLVPPSLLFQCVLKYDHNLHV